MKTLLQTFAGVFLMLTGIAVMYYFITTLDKGANFLFFGVSLLFIGGGVFFLFKAGKSDSTVTSKIPDNIAKTMEKTTADGSKTLDKNNAMVKEWNDVNTQKDKLKMVEMSAAAKAQDTANQ